MLVVTILLVLQTVTALPISKRDVQSTDAPYNDIYGCKTNPLVNISSADDLSKVPYGCKYDALAYYLLNIGWQAHTNLTWLVQNNNTFNDNFGAFIKTFQSSLETGFLTFLQKASPLQYYSCDGSTSDYDSCTSYGFDDMGREIKQSWCVLGYNNLRLIPEKTDDFLAALGPYVNVDLHNGSVGTIDYHYEADFVSGSNCIFQLYTNIDMPLAVNIDPNPMQFITAENVTDLQTLLQTANTHFGSSSGADLVDALTPTAIYYNMSLSISQLNDLGKEIKKEEKERTALMIVSVVFGLVGAGCLFLGPLEGAIMGSILALSQVMADYAITGTVDASDIISGVLSCFSGIFEVAKAGALIINASNIYRFMKTGQTLMQMYSFSAFANPRLAIFSLQLEGNS